MIPCVERAFSGARRIINGAGAAEVRPLSNFVAPAVYINSPEVRAAQRRGEPAWWDGQRMNEFFIRDPFLFVIALNELKYGRAIQLIFRWAHSGGTPMDKKPFMETQTRASG